jgi:epsilon-lactone hydrolase
MLLLSSHIFALLLRNYVFCNRLSATSNLGDHPMPSWQAYVAALILRLTMKRRPEGGEKEIVEFVRGKLDSPFLLRPPIPKGAKVSQVGEDGVCGEWVEWTDDPQSTIYYLHGGGYLACSPETHRSLTIALSRAVRARIFALDYRLAPEHRFPAAVEDAVNGYLWLIKNGVDPGNIIIGGDSAGGGLTLATLISLRDAGEKLPRAAFCLSPWTDLKGTGESLKANNHSDSMFYGESITVVAQIYLGSRLADDPLASPIYADLSNLPPLLIYASSSEVLLDDSVRLAERARGYGVDVDLRIWEDLPHAWPFLVAFKVPEACQVIDEIANFINEYDKLYALKVSPKLETVLKKNDE